MQYEVLKPVIIDGKGYATGEVLDLTHQKVERLVMLGYIAPVDEAPAEVETRVVTPKRTRKAK